MPKSHQKYLDWTPDRIIRWASKTGAATAQTIKIIMKNRSHPQQGFRSCMGIMSLGKEYSQERLEAACARALAIGGTSFKSIQSILKAGLDRRALFEQHRETPPIHHANIRGPHYYNSMKGGQSC